MATQLIRYVFLVLFVVVSACSAGRSSGGESSDEDGVVSPASGAASNPVAVRSLSPQTQQQSFQLAQLAVPALVAERTPDGRPALYYGRVFVRTAAELAVLDLFAFQHDIRPFFEDWQATRNIPIDTSRLAGGRWEYAIATGVQWNVLIDTPGLVSAIEFNPRLDPTSAYPQLDAMLASGSGGSLGFSDIGRAGFTFQTPPAPKNYCAISATRPLAMRPLGLFDFVGDAIDGIGDALGDALGAIGDEIADKFRKLGKDIGTVMRKAYAGVQEAIDLLRELGNIGVCALAGKWSHDGTVNVDLTNFDLPRREPLRSIPVQARGGIAGLLLTRTDANADGTYHFGDFCDGVDYTVYVLLDGPAAWVTNDGYSKFKVDLGTVSEGTSHKDWVTEHSAAIWLAGAQLGRKFAQDRFKFSPDQAKIVVGWVVDEVLAPFGGGKSFAMCGGLALVTGVSGTLASALVVANPVLASLASAAAGPLLDADIYGHGGAHNTLGTAVHEYGHFVMCRAIAQLGGDLDAFMNKYTLSVLPGTGETDNVKRLMDPVRNSSEAFADYVAFHTVGLTDYFDFCPNDRAGICLAADPVCTGGRCLEPDAEFVYPTTPVSDEHAHEVVASRTSVMFDWTDQSTTNPLPFADDDALVIAQNLIAKAVALNGNSPTTQSMSRWLAGQNPAWSEGFCNVYASHGWGCDDHSSAGANLEAPQGFDGIALSQTDILWSWVPTSHLASQYVFVNASGNTFVDVATIPPNTFSYRQTVAGTGGNRRAVAAVEARAPNANAGRSSRQTRCTLADAAANVTATATADRVLLSWASSSATDYAVSRAPNVNGIAGTYTQLAIVTANTYEDLTAAPGVPYFYRVNARNCDSRETTGQSVAASLAFNDTNFVYVSSSATATGANGTRAKPFRTIQAALAVVTATRNRVIVAQGTYAERLGISTDRVYVYGGYDTAFTTRNTVTQASTLIGDNSEWSASGSGEFPPFYHALIGAGTADLTLDGLIVDTSLRTGCPAGGCYRLQFVVANKLVLREVRYVEGAGVPAPRGAADYVYFPSISVSELDASDSSVDVSRASGAALPTAERLAIRAGRIRANKSTFIGASDRTLISGSFVTLDGSVVRGPASTWTAANSVGVEGGCATITNSVITGRTALAAGGRFCIRDVIANSLFYGRVKNYRARFINNIFVGHAEPLLELGIEGEQLCPPGGCAYEVMTGNEVVNNLFMPLSDQAIGRTRWHTHLQRPLVDGASVNDAPAWFGSSANVARGNLVSTALDQVFASGQAVPSVIGMPFHPALSNASLVTRTSGTEVSSYGITLTHDLDAVARTAGNLSIGPYQH